MPHRADGPDLNKGIMPNAENRYEVTRADLPLHCPMKGMSLWNSHPRVYIPLDRTEDGMERCPYCGAIYVLKDFERPPGKG